MKSSHIVCALFAGVIGAIVLAYEAVQPAYSDGKSCVADREVAYGSTDRRTSFAELAAISNWQKATEKKRPGFGEWHQARDRKMSCKLYKESAHIQCIVSATPCKLDKS